jgi:dienelactone hydrolase
MNKNRREFLKISGLAFAGISAGKTELIDTKIHSNTIFDNKIMNNKTSIIGQYGDWASKLRGNKLPKLSFRNKEFTNLKTWQKTAKTRTIERMGVPDIGPLPTVTLNETFEYDGLHIEKLSWQLPYGRPTEAILLKPINAQGKLPAVLALHDHGGNKYFGTRKITKTSDSQHPMMVTHQSEYYEGQAWANEIAKRGYVVLVSDSFAFASRRVMLQDVPEYNREGLTDNEPEKQENIDAYNNWASQHGHTLAKSLFCAGTTWPGVFYAEDKKALDILCARQDVDSQRVGCCGLSGGGLRTVYLAGLDSRIKCAIPVGFMTTWDDFLLNKSFTHTWMTYVPMLPNELDFPEILGLRTPLPTLVLNDIDDSLYTIDEMKKADVILKEVFKKANADSNYKCSFYPGPHKFDKKMQEEAFTWFDKWLM